MKILQIYAPHTMFKGYAGGCKLQTPPWERKLEHGNQRHLVQKCCSQNHFIDKGYYYYEQMFAPLGFSCTVIHLFLV